MGINLSYICIYCHKGIDHTEPGWGISDFGQFHEECSEQFKQTLGGYDGEEN